MKYLAKVSIFKYRFEVLLLFVIGEVLLFETNDNLHLLITLIEYLFVFIALVNNYRIGIMYFVSFTLLALSQDNFLIHDSLPNSFWGVRAFGFSLNIIFSFLIFIYCIVITKKTKIKIDINLKFFIYFIIYSIISGTVFILLSKNYIDNFVQDLLTYSPFFIYSYLLSLLDVISLKEIIKKGLSLTVFAMILSYISNKMFQYGEGNYFVLVNNFSFIVIFAVFILRDLFKKWQYILLISCIIFLLLNGDIFIGGKQIILLFVVLFWFALNYKKYAIPILLLFVFFILFIEPTISFISNYYAGNVISFKFTQIFTLVENFDLSLIASTKSSMGNIIAEAITLFDYFVDNPILLVTGKGFGGAIPDTMGYLAPWAGSSGYAYQDLSRNDFHKLHLPVYEIILKTGLLGFLFYFYIIVRFFKSKNRYMLIYLILFLTVFYVTKELLLITLVFLSISKQVEINSNI